MKISDFTLTEDNDTIRANARVQFEDCPNPEKQVFIKTSKKYADDFFANPHAFLVGCLLPAIHLGEKRILID